VLLVDRGRFVLIVIEELRKEEGRLSSIVVEHEEDVADYFELRKKLDELAADFKEVITHPSYSLPFLQPGRLVLIKHLQLDFGWGVVINYQKRLPPRVSCFMVGSVAYDTGN
jgi:ATP-dependent RNA helicase DOB1